ncbi:MAG TPA: Ig-like domain-containing protein [Solirubrobacter sp.]
MVPHTKRLLRISAAAMTVLCASTASATLLDHGPGDPTLVFPQWYRDLNGLALSECLSQTPSPNGGAAGKPMCFPANPNPAGFAGNVGPEVFYNDLNILLGKGAAAASVNVFALRYVAALEGSYLPLGLPVHGTETVFGRIRITANVQVPGTYKVTHPFGVEIFNVTAADLGARAIFWTNDIPLAAPMNFDGALAGRLGPFLTWDFVDPGLVLNVTNGAGVVEQFVGDPNFLHTFTGSPFSTNFVRVDGPAGSNLDGVGNDFIQSPLGNVLGQKWTAPIPTPTTVKRATYARNPTLGITSIDVAAFSAPGQQIFMTGAGVPSIALVGDALGNYFGHVEIPASSPTPAGVTITNATSNPVVNVPAALVDLVNVTAASFDTLTGALKVTATTSDLSVPAPALVGAGPLGGAMTAGAYATTLAPGALPPLRVTVNSAAGGSDSDDVVILPGLPMNKAGAPVAVPDAVTTNENVAVTIPVTANDAAATVGSVVVVTPPASGTAAPAAALGSITYTPAANFFGADSFQYVVVDGTGNVSNVATVNVNVVFVAVGPTANPDDFAMIQNASTLAGHTVNVLANDTAAAGTTINAASVKIAAVPLHGTAVANADGTITYTPALKYTGADSFQYTVANGNGVASTAATVSVVVEGGPESVSIAKATYTVSKQLWTIVGSTNWFGPTLLHTTATCYVGSTTTGAVIGTAPIDTTGKFQLVPPTLTAPPPDATNIFTCQTSNGGKVSAVVRLQ